MKIYTKTGDQGQTGLFGGPRVAKCHVRIEAYGQVDELNAILGLARCQTLPPPVEQTLQRVQHELFAVGAELASPDPARHGVVLLGPAAIQRLEREIDHLEAGLPPLRQFILPAGCQAAALLHVARAVCRRAERAVVALAQSPDHSVSAGLIAYLNRLGDYLFVAARYANLEANVAEVAWQKPPPDGPA
jgi:cob(I)alamin adenosyltransferase